MNNYLLVDGLNMFMRAKHVGGRGDSIDMKIGMAMHIMFNSINKCWNKFDGTHVVLCLEGRSWNVEEASHDVKHFTTILQQVSISLKKARAGKLSISVQSKVLQLPWCVN